jgi:antitoxin VapB
VESTPRAYRLKASNAAPPFSTFAGTIPTQAVINALRERLAREERKEQAIESLVEDVMEIGRHCASLPLLDARSADDIIGYDDNGLPR